MPESRYKYLYERLGDQPFQQLVAALLARQFPNFTPMAMRQADGGRDGVRRDEHGNLLVYQVKWSVTGKERDPVRWLDETVRAEQINLERLVAEGVRHYTLVTNVASTGRRGSGTFDRLNVLLDGHRRALGLTTMECIWREGLDGSLDSAPTELKFNYADMLAGWDLVRFLIAEDASATTEHKLRRLVRHVAETQWKADELVKFNQSDVDREKVVDLFVDVTADRIQNTSRAARERPLGGIGGAAQHLIREVSTTLVRGAPGQGKSTLTQYLCQVHRAAFVPTDLVPPQLIKLGKETLPRFPLRFDLSDYARWLNGIDIWATPEDTQRRTRIRRPGHVSTVECFIADLITHDGGGVPLSAQDVHELFDRVPSLVVLDGLDEVGTPAVRTRVVKAIDQFATRAHSYPVPVSVLVTTRPSAGELSEPTPELFDVLALNPLTPEQRKNFLGKWCAVHGIHGQDARTVRVQFDELSKQPFIAELVGNPMQLTILLDLLHQHGAATPAQRTELYDQYVELLLAREANKHPEVVRRFREELKEIVPFLGWYLHAHGEENQVDGRMPVEAIKAAMRHFQRTYGHPESVVDKLFEGATDRLWTLTSKVDGTYEFDVLSLREYFAARFLYRSAGEGDREFDRAEVVRALLPRPYWLNTARFYGGNAKGGEIYELSAAVEAVLTDTPTAAACVAAWTLLTDGVFARRPREARKIITILCADQNLPVLLEALDRHDITALPELPALPDDDPDPTWQRLTNAIESSPVTIDNTTRVRVLRELLNARSAFTRWWLQHLALAAGTAAQNPWLALAAADEAAAGRSVQIDGLALDDGAAQLLLNTGAIPGRGTGVEAAVLDAVWHGECPDVTSIRSLPAQVAVALSPEAFYTQPGSGFVLHDAASSRRRSDAIIQLRKTWPAIAEIAAARRFGAGQRGSTFPWVNVSTALTGAIGRCWLASEIAIIGAASPMRLGYSRYPGRSAFGPNGHPSELLGQCRKNAHDTTWWRSTLEETDDELGRAEWTLALWARGDDTTREALSALWYEIFAALPVRYARVVRAAAARIARHGWLHSRDDTSDTRYDLHTGPMPWQLHAWSTQPSALSSSSAASTPSSQPLDASLLAVARERKWLKVDAQAVYR
ncbi:MAG: large ATP-binding protein [Tomitella sp.]|nr:large ATP-binding protein [Tomitella sp.]